MQAKEAAAICTNMLFSSTKESPQWSSVPRQSDRSIWRTFGWLRFCPVIDDCIDTVEQKRELGGGLFPTFIDSLVSFFFFLNCFFSTSTSAETLPSFFWAAPEGKILLQNIEKELVFFLIFIESSVRFFCEEAASMKRFQSCSSWQKQCWCVTTGRTASPTENLEGGLWILAVLVLCTYPEICVLQYFFEKRLYWKAKRSEGSLKRLLISAHLTAVVIPRKYNLLLNDSSCKNRLSLKTVFSGIRNSKTAFALFLKNRPPPVLPDGLRPERQITANEFSNSAQHWKFAGIFKCIGQDPISQLSVNRAGQEVSFLPASIYLKVTEFMF